MTTPKGFEELNRTTFHKLFRVVELKTLLGIPCIQSRTLPMPIRPVPRTMIAIAMARLTTIVMASCGAVWSGFPEVSDL